MTAHRHPPMPEHPNSGCRWCTMPVAKGVKGHARSWHDGRGQEPDCLFAYYLATRSDQQRHSCRNRDHGICSKCGEDCTVARPIKGRLCYVYDRDMRESFPSTDVIWVEPWQADHIVALKDVPEGLPRLEALVYWSLANLQTLCLRCHAEKTGHEARMRARGKRDKAARKTKHQRYVEARAARRAMP